MPFIHIVSLYYLFHAAFYTALNSVRSKIPAVGRKPFYSQGLGDEDKLNPLVSTSLSAAICQQRLWNIMA